MGEYIEPTGGALNSQVSYSKDGLITTSYADDYISRGNAFQFHRIFTIPAAGTKIIVDFSTATGKQIFTLPIRMAVNESQVFVSTYIVDTYTGGTEIPAINRNRLVDNDSLTTVKSGVTSTDTAGDDLREYIIGALSTNQNPGGGTGGGASPKIFDNKKLIIDVVNQEADTIYLEINFNWYEL